MSQLGNYKTNCIMYINILLNGELAKHSVMIPSFTECLQVFTLPMHWFLMEVRLKSYQCQTFRNLRRVILNQFNM